MKLTLPNQSINVLRQLLGIPGVSKTAQEIYQDGELLCVVIPEPDTKWVLSYEEKMKLSVVVLKEYVARDEAFAAAEVEIEVTEKQRDRIKAVLSLAPTLSGIPQSKFLFRLYKELGFAPS